ncbi:hypothetical protein [uncultured Clostridium sp.]|uniref:hypothetical protein n=1 Tax=uncultured Clostridium sp. TaxID=59620 RepID=UPI0025852438|nr:hypothetical protein [uncultured Clostridium sp.]
MYFEYKGKVIKNILLLICGVILSVGSYYGAGAGESYIIFTGLIFVSLYNLIRLGYHYLSWEVPFFYFLRGKGIIITVALVTALVVIGMMTDK